jgi:ComF family protein
LAAARGALLDVEALALPAACLGCDRALRPVDEEAVLCAGCRNRLRPIAPPVCRRCGQPLDRWDETVEPDRVAERPRSASEGAVRTLDRLGEAAERPRSASEGAVRAVRPSERAGGATPPTNRERAGGATPRSNCAFCRPWPEALVWVASAVWLEDGPARYLVHALKYSGWRIAARPMAAAMARECAGSLRGVEALVPVPLGRVRRRERGHNQAGVLAAALGERLGVRSIEDALVRSRETKTQTALAPLERRRNVSGAFRAGGRRLDGLHVAIVDDVLTTGATLGAAAEALAASGAARIGAVTFGRALIPA